MLTIFEVEYSILLSLMLTFNCLLIIKDTRSNINFFSLSNFSFKNPSCPPDLSRLIPPEKMSVLPYIH